MASKPILSSEQKEERENRKIEALKRERWNKTHPLQGGLPQ